MTTITFRTRADVQPVTAPSAAVSLERAAQTHPVASPHTVGELITAYEREYLPTQAPNTQKQKRIVFRSIRAEFGAMPVTALTPDLLRQWRDQLCTRLAPGTVGRWLDTFGGLLTVAVRDCGWLAENPLRLVRKPSQPPGRARFLSRDELARLLQACHTSRNSHLYLLVLLALTTGARKMEMLRLRWADIDLEHGFLRLAQTKNKERRAVPVTGRALTLLRQQVQCQQSAWVFPGRTGQTSMSFARAWYHARRRAGLRDFHFHDLRHTAASYLAMSGASLLEIAQVLGHKSLRMTQRYSHFTQEHTAAVVERMSQKFLACEQPQEGAPHAEL